MGCGDTHTHTATATRSSHTHIGKMIPFRTRASGEPMDCSIGFDRHYSTRSQHCWPPAEWQSQTHKKKTNRFRTDPKTSKIMFVQHTITHWQHTKHFCAQFIIFIWHWYHLMWSIYLWMTEGDQTASEMENTNIQRIMVYAWTEYQNRSRWRQQWLAHISSQ